MKNLGDNIIVVGSSNSVLLKELGTSIDSYDNIFRFNRAPVEKYEPFVGSRTTHRFCNNHVVLNTFIEGQDMEFLPSLRGEIIISDHLLKPHIFHKTFDESCSIERIDRTVEFERRFITLSSNPEFVKLGRYPAHQPSAGLGIICFLLNRKKKVTIYGFDVENPDPTSSPHYWWKKGKAGKYHDLGYERRFINLLLEGNYIQYLE